MSSLDILFVVPPTFGSFPHVWPAGGKPQGCCVLGTPKGSRISPVGLSPSKPQGSQRSWHRGWLGHMAPCTLRLQTARTNLIICSYL